MCESAPSLSLLAISFTFTHSALPKAGRNLFRQVAIFIENKPEGLSYILIFTSTYLHFLIFAMMESASGDVLEMHS